MSSCLMTHPGPFHSNDGIFSSSRIDFHMEVFCIRISFFQVNHTDLVELCIPQKDQQQLNK
jgi:hypothetical protein